MNPGYLVMWVGVGVIVVGVIVFLYRMVSIPEKMIEASQAEQAHAQADAVAAQDAGARLREIGLARMRAGHVPDPDTQFERQLLIDGIVMQLHAFGMTMPDSMRQLLDHLTVQELKDFAG